MLGAGVRACAWVGAWVCARVGRACVEQHASQRRNRVPRASPPAPSASRPSATVHLKTTPAHPVPRRLRAGLNARASTWEGGAALQAKCEAGTRPSEGARQCGPARVRRTGQPREAPLKLEQPPPARGRALALLFRRCHRRPARRADSRRVRSSLAPHLQPRLRVDLRELLGQRLALHEVEPCGGRRQRLLRHLNPTLQRGLDHRACLCVRGGWPYHALLPPPPPLGSGASLPRCALQAHRRCEPRRCLPPASELLRRDALLQGRDDAQGLLVGCCRRRRRRRCWRLPLCHLTCLGHTHAPHTHVPLLLRVCGLLLRAQLLQPLLGAHDQARNQACSWLRRLRSSVPRPRSVREGGGCGQRISESRELFARLCTQRGLGGCEGERPRRGCEGERRGCHA